MKDIEIRNRIERECSDDWADYAFNNACDSGLAFSYGSHASFDTDFIVPIEDDKYAEGNVTIRYKVIDTSFGHEFGVEPDWDIEITDFEILDYTIKDEY